MTPLPPFRLARRRGLESYHPFWIGTIALALVAVVVAALLLVRSAGFGYTRYDAEFAQAAQLRPGDPVSVAGIAVGQVKNIRLAGTKVAVEMRVRDDVTLGSQTRAAIKLTTLLGSRYVELRPGGTGRIADKVIRLPATEVSYDLQALLTDATTTFEKVDADRMATALGVLARQLDGLPAALPPAMANLERLSGTIAARREQIGTLLKSAATITDTLHRQQASLGNLVFEGRDLLGEFVARRASFQRLMVSLTKLVDLLSRVLVKDRPAFEELLGNARQLTAMVSDHDDMFRNLLQVLPVPIRNFTNAMGYSPSFEVFPTNGWLVDDWVCVISGRNKFSGLAEYFKDCE